MEITKDKDNLIVKVPLRAEKWNPYEEMATGNGYVGEMDNICGFISKKDDWEIGFAFRIDRSDKGKDDDVSPLFLHYDKGRKELEKLCKDLGIDIFYF